MNNNSILIKDTKGQLKTVDLGVLQKHKNTENTPRLRSGQAKTQKKFNNLTIQQFNNKPSQKEKLETKDLSYPPIPSETMTPSFYFDLKDEQEVARFRDKEQIIQHKKLQTILEYIIDKIMKESNLELPTNVINRLRRVIESRLRDIRDLRETKEVLVRNKELGGAGLSDGDAQKILKIIESKRLGIEERINETESIISNQGLNNKNQDVKTSGYQDILSKVKPISTYVHPSYRQDKGVGDTKKKKTPGQVLTTSQEIIQPQKGVNIFKQNEKHKYITPIKTGTLFQPAQQLTKKFHQTIGPIEELAYFDIQNFRALSNDPCLAAQKIKNKIDLLKDESYEKWAQGIKAWRFSEVYQSYLSLGQLSMEQNKPVNQIIKEGQMRNEPTLSVEEFEALADLSQELSC